MGHAEIVSDVVVDGYILHPTLSEHVVLWHEVDRLLLSSSMLQSIEQSVTVVLDQHDVGSALWSE